MKKPTKSQLKRKADLLFAKLVRSRGECEMCGKDGLRVQLQCAHVVSRRYLHLRYDKNNALCLCAGCHRIWHDDPHWAISWWKAFFPERDIYLSREKQVIEHFLDYELVIERLKNVCPKNS